MTTQVAQHTPGPWTMVRYNETTLTIVAPWSTRVTTGMPGWGDYRGIHTATITHHASVGGCVTREHAEANAHLIAAAPELLEAAHNVDAIYAEMQAALPSLVGKPGWDVVQRAVQQARAAIAKAEGKQND